MLIIEDYWICPLSKELRWLDMEYSSIGFCRNSKKGIELGIDDKSLDNTLKKYHLGKYSGEGPLRKFKESIIDQHKMIITSKDFIELNEKLREEYRPKLSSFIESEFASKTDIKSSKQSSNYKPNPVLSIIIAIFSLFLPFYFIGSTPVNTFKLAQVTQGFNFDIISALMIIISPIIVLVNISKNSIMTSGVLSGLGLLLVLNRAIKISSAGNDFGSLNPSIGPGLVLFGVAAIIQLIGLYQENSKVLESEDVESKDKTEKSKQSLKDGDIPHKIEELAKLKEQGILTAKEFNAKKKELLNRM